MLRYHCGSVSTAGLHVFHRPCPPPQAARLRKEATSAQAEAVDARREADEERRRMLADADAARVAALRERGELEDRLRSLEVKSREEIESMKKRHREELEAEKRAAVATARSLEHQLEGARALAEMAARVDR